MFAMKAASPAVAVPSFFMARNMTTGGTKAFNERERAAETIWFNKEEEKLIQKMAARMKEHKQVDSAIEGLAAKYNMSPADKELIMRAAHGMSIADLMLTKTA